MCLQCLTKPDVFEAPFKGYSLMRASKNDYEEPQTWFKGEFGLVQCNDPTFYFQTIPIRVEKEWIEDDLTDEQLENDEYYHAFMNACDVAEAIADEILTCTQRLGDVVHLYKAVQAEFPQVELDTPTMFALGLMKLLYQSYSKGFKTDEEMNAEYAASANNTLYPDDPIENYLRDALEDAVIAMLEEKVRIPSPLTITLPKDEYKLWERYARMSGQLSGEIKVENFGVTPSELNYKVQGISIKIKSEPEPVKETIQ